MCSSARDRPLSIKDRKSHSNFTPVIQDCTVTLYILQPEFPSSNPWLLFLYDRHTKFDITILNN